MFGYCRRFCRAGVERSKFEGNRAALGGAMYVADVESQRGNLSIIVVGSSFERNQAVGGGAIFHAVRSTLRASSSLLARPLLFSALSAAPICSAKSSTRCNFYSKQFSMQPSRYGK